MTPPDDAADAEDVGSSEGVVRVRRAGVDDAAAVASVHLRSRRAAPMPPPVHADEEAEPFFAGRLDDAAPDEVWLAEVDGEPVAYVRLTDAWLDDLYVVPEHAGRGIGSMLLDLATSLRPDGFGLWVFEVNEPARAFYARRGLVEVERTDGRDNEERAPDVRMTWG